MAGLEELTRLDTDVASLGGNVTLFYDQTANRQLELDKEYVPGMIALDAIGSHLEKTPI